MPMYASLVLALVAARLLIRWLAPRPPVRSADPPDYPVIAHLAGGRRRVTLAAVAAARVAGAIDVLPLGTAFRFRPGPGGLRRRGGGGQGLRAGTALAVGP